MQCPYHAWTYDLDGRLRRRRGPSASPASTRRDLPAAGPVDTWGPFVFVNAIPMRRRWRTVLGELPDRRRAERAGPRAAVHSHREWRIAANWKVVIENYLECYHCPRSHTPTSARSSTSTQTPTHSRVADLLEPGRPDRQSALDGNGRAAYDPRGDVTQAQFHFLWPATTINVVPGPAEHLDERWLPTGPTETVEVTDYWFGADVTAS